MMHMTMTRRVMVGRASAENMQLADLTLWLARLSVAWKRESVETEWELVNNQTTNNYSFSEN